MVDFTKLLQQPAGQAKKPEALPAGDYPARIKTFEVGDNNKKKTPYVRFHVVLTGWPDGGEVQQDVDLSKRQLRRDFFLTDDALWRLDEFITSCGVEANGRGYNEILPELSGKDVIAEVQQYMGQTSGEIGNQIGKLVGTGG